MRAIHATATFHQDRFPATTMMGKPTTQAVLPDAKRDAFEPQFGFSRTTLTAIGATVVMALPNCGGSAPTSRPVNSVTRDIPAVTVADTKVEIVFLDKRVGTNYDSGRATDDGGLDRTQKGCQKVARARLEALPKEVLSTIARVECWWTGPNNNDYAAEVVYKSPQAAMAADVRRQILSQA